MSRSSIADKDSNWTPTPQEAGTALRDSDLDFGELGDAMIRAQVTPWQAHIIFKAFTKVMAGRTITPDLVNMTERKLRGIVKVCAFRNFINTLASLFN